MPTEPNRAHRIRPSQVYIASREEILQRCKEQGLRVIAFAQPRRGDRVLASRHGTYSFIADYNFADKYPANNPLGWRLIVEKLP